jgi:hypothetical protein
MAEKIALNRVPEESDSGRRRDDVGIARIDAAPEDPHRINGMIQSGALAP